MSSSREVAVLKRLLQGEGEGELTDYHFNSNVYVDGLNDDWGARPKEIRHL